MVIFSWNHFCWFITELEDVWKTLPHHLFFTTQRIFFPGSSDKLPFFWLHMDVSENNGTPKSSIVIGFSITNHPFWSTPIFGNTNMYIYYIEYVDAQYEQIPFPETEQCFCPWKKGLKLPPKKETGLSPNHQVFRGFCCYTPANKKCTFLCFPGDND